jgi:ABC-type multidrug transport system fused ATPase/permease subunit
MAIFAFSMGMRIATWYVAQSSLLFIREKIIFKLRSTVFAHLQALCLRFHSRYNPGFLYDRTLGNASLAVGTFLSMLFNSLVLYTFQFIFALVICVRLHAGLTLYVLAMSLGYVFLSRYYGAKIRELTIEFNRKANAFAGLVVDLLRGVKTIKAFAMEERVISAFDEQLWPLQLRSLDVNKHAMCLNFLAEGLGFLIQGAIVLAGAYLIIPGAISAGTMVAFIAYQQMIIGQIASLSAISAAYGAAHAGLEQIYEIIDERPTVSEKPGAVMPAVVPEGFCLEGVHFAFDGTPVLRDISVTIPPGQSVALVGPSGGGKTTFINLLLRFYDPDSGVIRLGEHDIRDLPVAGYRSQFGVVLQDPFLFNDTIFNNLTAVKPEATEAEVRRALELAQAWEFVAGLKGGWDFEVGEGGGNLSGGQRQRIAIARCFLTDPRVMILDEATSALDNQSELLVQQALRTMMQGRTVIIIAHRLSTVRHVDRILVLQEGCIVQDGSYEALSATPGLFRDLQTASQHTLAGEI